MSVHWFDYLLTPDRLQVQLEGKELGKEEVSSLLKEFITNLLNSQNCVFFSENRFELWCCESTERKIPVLCNLSLQLAASLDWRLGELEEILPPPLLLYILQMYIQSQPAIPNAALQKIPSHLELSVAQIADPGPTLHSLILFHRWIVRTYIKCRTPQRLERTSTVMVPGVKRDPALIFRDQTNNLVVSLAETSLKFLQSTLESGIAPCALPSPASFSTYHTYSVPEWNNLNTCNPNLMKALIAYDLGCCYFFNEDYAYATSCFNLYFNFSAGISDLLSSDIQEAKLNGYLQCLGLQTIENKSTGIRFLESAAEQLESLVPALDEDTFSRTISDLDIELVQQELTKTSTNPGARKELLPKLTVHSLIRRTLRGLPLTMRMVEQVSNLDKQSAVVLEQLISKVAKQGSDKDKHLMNALVQQLALFGVIQSGSTCLQHFPDVVFLTDLEAKPPNLKIEMPPCESFNLPKINRYNAAVQLLSTFKVPLLTALNKNLRPAAQVSQRWHIEDYYQKLLNKMPKPLPNFDDVSVILAKVNQLKKMGCWDEATEMLSQLCVDLTNDMKRGPQAATSLVKALEGDQLAAQLVKRRLKEEAGEELDDEPAYEKVKATCLPFGSGDTYITGLQGLCLNRIVSAGDWNTILTRTVQRSGLVPSLARSLASLLTNLNSNNPQILKKFGREIWDLVVPFLSSGANKRTKDQQQQSASPIKDKLDMVKFLERVSHPDLAMLILSLLSTLFNVARDDPSTELLSVYSNVWPTGLSTNPSIVESQVQDLMQTVLSAFLMRFPKDPNVLQTAADLQYANSNYTAALAGYTEMVAVKTDFFQLPIDGSVLNDCYINRMVRCCSELGRLTQAVILSQFNQEPNYAQVFKYLEDKDSKDATDSLYACIWDMTILEFAMSLHTKRGEVARRRHVLSCIMILELNTNNEQEIKQEAANIRKSIFFRSLASQFFTEA